jgi:hypothetical protein
MPIVNVKGFGKFHMPEGMSRDQMETAIRVKISEITTREAFGSSNAAKPYEPLPDWAEGYLDPGIGAIQFASKFGPKALNERIQNQVNARELGIAKQRKAEGDEGFDVGRMLGSVGATLPMGFAGMVPRALSFMGAVGRGAASGAGGSLLAPKVADKESDYWKQTRDQGILGGVLGAGLGGAGAFLAPKVTAQAQKLMDRGVRLTRGQQAGGTVKRIEDMGRSMPFMGAKITEETNKSLDDFNRALGQDLLSDVGEILPESVKPGHGMISYVTKKVSDKYDDTLAKMSGQMDDELDDDIMQIYGQYVDSNAPKGLRKEFEGLLQREVIDTIGSGPVDGKVLQATQSHIKDAIAKNKRAKEYLRGRVLVDAQEQLKDAIDRMLARQNAPDLVDDLAGANRAFAKRKILDDAFSRAGVDARGGFVMPSQYGAAIRAARSTTKSQIAQGKGLGQDFAAAAEEMLPPKYADSGTAGRSLSNMGGILSILGLAGEVDPIVGASIFGTGALGSLPYYLPQSVSPMLRDAMTAGTPGLSMLMSMPQTPDLSGMQPELYNPLFPR